MVVNGYAAMATFAKVLALKNVLFPVDGFPTSPININYRENAGLNKLRLVEERKKVTKKYLNTFLNG